MVSIILTLAEFCAFHQEINCTILEVFVFNVVNPNPKALWEIIELQSTDQIKLNEQWYRLNCTV